MIVTITLTEIVNESELTENDDRNMSPQLEDRRGKTGHFLVQSPDWNGVPGGAITMTMKEFAQWLHASGIKLVTQECYHVLSQYNTGRQKYTPALVGVFIYYLKLRYTFYVEI